jgi:hypothetical protein
LTRSAFEELKRLGGNVKYTELQGVGHGANAYAFAYIRDYPSEGFITHYSGDRCDETSDVWDWLFRQRRGGSMPSSATGPAMGTISD